MDRESLAFGVLFAITAQSLYEMIFYGVMGEFIQEWASFFAFVGSIGFFIIAFYGTGWFRKKDKRK